ncbi:permease [Clostridium sp. JS66]|uniref:permease n=1 Tax=Clostridium sp. JS66 TaxID=3064705 RepID=UPI00298D9F15|nr:permease [Clostridium sp. JS66]WPC43781.1 permease [Clostridium sp. JS66]
MMKKMLKRYRVFGIVLIINLILLIVKPSLGMNSLKGTRDNLKELLAIMPPIFLIMGLLDTWVEKETMIKFMGEGSGLKGIVIAFLLGSFAAGPVYVAFPFAAILMKKGSKFFNILIFIGAWSATKIPISLFEASVMGWKFMLTRYAIDIPVIILIAYITDKIISPIEKETIYKNIKNLE